LLGSSPVSGLSGTAIYLNTDGTAGLGTTDELIAIVQGSSGLTLTSSYFTYV
jgi:serralysin